MKIQLEINGIEDRRAVAAILVANGYTVRLAKVKTTRVKTVLEAEKRGGKQNDKKVRDLRRVV